MVNNKLEEISIYKCYDISVASLENLLGILQNINLTLYSFNMTIDDNNASIANKVIKEASLN
jgi:hypothetical protein